MNHKVVAIMGSPHSGGNVAHAVQTIVEGAGTAKVDVSRYDLCKLNIKNCIGCRKCVHNGGECVLQDDMKAIFEEIKTADTLLIGSPIYICQVNGFVKTFLDRLYPLTDERHRPRFGTRKLIMLYTYGAPVPLIFNRYIQYTGKSLKAMGLLLDKNIVIHGCTTLETVKHNKKLLQKLHKYGVALGG